MTRSAPRDDAPMARVDRYLACLELPPERAASLRREVAAGRPRTHAAALERLRAALSATHAAPNGGDDIAARFAAMAPALGQRTDRKPGTGYRGATMPGLCRRSMSPTAIDRRPWRVLSRFFPGIARRLRLPKPARSRLKPVLRRRHWLLFCLVVLPAAAATFYMLTVLPHHGRWPIEMAILGLASLLFAWILVGFWTAVAGFGVLCFGERHRLDAGRDMPSSPPDRSARTAVVMPIHEEDVARTFAGVRAMYESLAETGRAESFDWFVLSDSVSPDTQVAEERAWADTCRRLGAFGRLFYRRRSARVKRKSGNIADFCRRWGARYRYMIVLDADSIMAGSTLTALVDRMEANPDVGLIQTPPIAINRFSVLARVQQFATRVYAPMFAAGLHYWHLDNAHYWGHNAILRVAPFMRHCALPRLPGRGALSGEILSHDFVEAALMRRAGWGVYIAYDLGGSYEEVPPTLIEELGRDRRWCQGNIQHLRLLFSDHLAPAHRALFANGVMAYTSAAIWLVFLILSSTEAVLEAIRPTDYFPSPGALFPAWPVWRPIWALSLFSATMVVLFLPKVLGLVRVAALGRAADFGGITRLIASTLMEIVLTTLLAPIRMLAHSVFVFTTLLGRPVGWAGQQRADARVPWRAAFFFHAPGMLLAVLWGALLYVETPGFFPWLLPILTPLALAPWLTVLTSRMDLGLRLRALRLQLIPEERRPPPELAHTAAAVATVPLVDRVDAVVDPALNALHVGLLGGRRRLHPDVAARRDALAQRLLAAGPDALDRAEWRALLADPERMTTLHRVLWSAGAPPAWAAARMERDMPLTSPAAAAV